MTQRRVVILMGKSPILGQVKTRMMPEFSPLQAAQLHQAMVNCILQRTVKHLPADQYVLALAGANVNAGLGIDLPDQWQMIDQGQGSLGERMGRLWEQFADDAAVFLGGDIPDLPVGHYHDIEQLLNHAIESNLLCELGQIVAAIGPVDDGGYWTLVANQLRLQLLQGIDWGSDKVCHQTVQAACEAKINLVNLPSWYDIDRPSDLLQLMGRLAKSSEKLLIDLGKNLQTIIEVEK